MQRFGFGDFVILNPQTKEEIMRIKDLKDLQKKVFQIPDDSLVYHLSRNHFSRFFYSRAMFPPAEVLKRVYVSDYKDMDEARKLIFDLIVQYRRMKNFGVVAVYQKERFDEYSNFARIGDGSLGGKGRGPCVYRGDGEALSQAGTRTFCGDHSEDGRDLYGYLRRIYGDERTVSGRFERCG